MLFDFIGDPSKWRYYPPHHLVHSIETNCAYHKSYRNQAVTLERINQIVNHYNSYHDPYLQHVLEEMKSLELCALAMARQQFPLQARPRITELTRSLMLFVRDIPLPVIAERFAKRYGFTLGDWVYLNFAIQAYTLNQKSPLTSVSNYTESEIDSIPRDAVQPFLEMSSLTPGQIAEQYHSVREEFPIYLHIFIPSVFLKYPLIAYDDGEYLVVHPGLISRHAIDGLYRICEELDSETFHSEFADSFELYVGRVFEDLIGKNRVWTESEIQSISPGRTCDYVIDHQDCLLLVECKSARYSATLLTENAVAGDNSTGKIAEAFEQLYHTAVRINDKRLVEVLGSQWKPMLGFVVTFGDLHFTNSPSYHQSFIIPRADLPDQERWPYPLAEEPQVVSINTLEDLVIVLNSQRLSPVELVNRKLSQDYYKDGDWPPYLAAYASKVEEWALPVLKEMSDHFFSTVVGVSSAEA
jgi:hypothetical protein